MNKQDKRRAIGASLVIFSSVGIGLFKHLGINETIFYMSLGWGLGMLL